MPERRRNDAISMRTGWDYIWGRGRWNNTHIYTETCRSAWLLPPSWIWCVFCICALDLALYLIHIFIKQRGLLCTYLCMTWVRNGTLKKKKKKGRKCGKILFIQADKNTYTNRLAPLLSLFLPPHPVLLLIRSPFMVRSNKTSIGSSPKETCLFCGFTEC